MTAMEKKSAEISHNSIVQSTRHQTSADLTHLKWNLKWKLNPGVTKYIIWSNAAVFNNIAQCKVLNYFLNTGHLSTDTGEKKLWKYPDKINPLTLYQFLPFLLFLHQPGLKLSVSAEGIMINIRSIRWGTRILSPSFLLQVEFSLSHNYFSRAAFLLRSPSKIPAQWFS